MLNIEIINGNTTTGHLEFKVNGRHGNGNGSAKRKWQVHWRVKPNIPVLSIHGITKKELPPSTDIFSDNPPSKKDSHGKHWKAKVNGNAPVFAEYIYEIKWVSNLGIKTHDPKISVMPSVGPIAKLLTAICIAITGFLALKFLQKKINR